MMQEEQLIADGYRKYSGKNVDVYFNASKCQHSAKCVRGDAEVFDTKRKPWIIADNGNAESVCQLIDTCPSGALLYVRHEEI